MPSDAWVDSGKRRMIRMNRMKGFLDMVNTSFFLTGFTGLTGYFCCCFFPFQKKGKKTIRLSTGKAKKE
jgi:hypothetical protein